MLCTSWSSPLSANVVTSGDERESHVVHHMSLSNEYTHILSYYASFIAHDYFIDTLGDSPHWVLNFGATDHIISISINFMSYSSHYDLSIVTLADHSTTPISSINSTSPYPNLPLYLVLHILKFSFNLISISKFAQLLQAIITFFPNSCFM